MNLNRNQIIALVIAVLGVLATSTTQLTDIFGPGPTKIIISASSMLTSILSSILAMFTGQSSIVKDVQAMPGVEKIQVNANANQTLAAIAVDPANDKVEPTQKDATAVAKIAQNGDHS